MKKIIALFLALVMVSAMLVACNGNGNTETTTADNNTTTTTAGNDETTTTVGGDETTTTVGGDETTTTVGGDETTTTVGGDETTTSTIETTTASADNNDEAWKKDLTYDNGILRSFMGAFKTTTFDADPENVYEIDANIFTEYEATIVILFSSTCGPCKNMMTNVLQPYYEKYGDKVMVIGVLQAGSNSSSEALSIANWKKANNVTFPTIVVGTQDAQGNFDTGIVYAGPFGTGLGSLGTGVPQTYICDRTGKVSNTIYGYDSGAEARIKSMVSTIRYSYK